MELFPPASSSPNSTSVLAMNMGEDIAGLMVRVQATDGDATKENEEEMRDSQRFAIDIRSARGWLISFMHIGIKGYWILKI